MTAGGDKWAEIRNVLERALQLPFEERRRFIVQNCPDPQLQALALLFVSDPEASLAGLMNSAGTPSLPASPWTGKRVGVYEVRNLIHEGGFGAVYQAIRADNTRKVVAIKFLRPDRDSQQMRELFESEMRALAQLSHPNIVAFLDAGATSDGRPFYTMEYVEGCNLVEYANRKQLHIAPRLRLFLQLCDAVQYAHEGLLVHRDLKPSNIRVTDEGRVKLLDFGVAQASRWELRGDDAFIGGAVGTMIYASPEQLSGEPVTTVSDVYSLGAILFELLTTKLPFPAKGIPPGDLMKMVCERMPPLVSDAVDANATALMDGQRLSRLRRALRGDLDSIVAKALQKEPHRRYPSAKELAGDIRGYLEARPVKARANTPLYRAQRFVGRNRTPVFAAAIAGLGLIVGFVTLWREQHVIQPAPAWVVSGAASSDAPRSSGPMSPEQMDRRGDDYHLGRGVLKDDAEAVNWYRKAAELGYPRGQSDLAYMYMWGYGVELDYPEALRLFREAAAKGDAKGENGLGIMNEFGRATEKNYVDAMNWYQAAARQGYSNALTNIGWMYHAGHGFPKDDGEAMRWFRKAAESADSAGGELAIGVLYRQQNNYDEALKWIRKAAESNDAAAQNEMGYVFEKGLGVPPNKDAAFNWYRKSANQDSPYGEFSLGEAFENGIGVAPDLAKAMNWYRKSANHGYSLAQGALGAIYADGALSNGRPNDVEAAKWFRMAADQDDPVAMDFLGEMYEKGKAVPPDIEQAISWYRKAAHEGSKEARANLTRLGVQ